MTRQDRETPSPPRVFPDLSHECALWAAGCRAVAGIDEVGRGALAGPVMAAAVVLPPDPSALAHLLGQVDDSKRLPAGARERLDGAIRACAVATGVGSVPAEEIDRIGIVPATRLAMALALDALAPCLSPDYLLIDFLTLPARPCPQLGLPHGDALSLSIAAASIVAKVARDAWMAAQDAVFAGYCFAAHKGYGTPAHQAALARLGPCPLHRRSFEPLTGSLARECFGLEAPPSTNFGNG
jgi:ribonuclease HII